MGMSAFGSFAARLGRSYSVLGSGFGAGLALSLITTIIVTHFVSVQSYGELALYLFVGSFVTIVCNMGSLQGTFGLVFGVSGDENGDFDLDRPLDQAGRDPRRLLGTGLTLTLIVSTTAASLVWVLAGPISTLLPHNPDGPELVRLAGLSGAMGALWRLQSNFLRYARRPVAFAITQAARPGFALVITAILVISGDGVRGVLIGLAVGTFIALLLALALSHRDIRPAFSFRDSREIMGHGKHLIPLIMSYWTVQHADVYVLSLWAGPATVGVYKLASTLSRMASYGVSAFTMSWGPLLHSPLAAAVERERGRQNQGAVTVGTYALIAAFVILAMGLLGDYLVKIAPHSFGSAADLIPLLALVPIGRGWFVVCYQTADFGKKRFWFVTMGATAGVLFLVSTSLLVPLLGAYGAGLAGVIAFYVPSTVYLVLSQHGGAPLPLPWRQILGGPIIAAGLLLGFYAVAPSGPARAVLIAVPLLAYPALLLLIGALPREPLRRLLHPAALWSRWQHRNDKLRARLEALSLGDRQLVDDLLRKRRPVAEVAAECGELELTILTRFGAVLKAVAGVAEGSVPSEGTARFVLFVGPAAQRQARGKALIEDGVDPLALDRLEETARQLRQKRWRRVGAVPAPVPQDLPAIVQPNIAQ